MQTTTQLSGHRKILQWLTPISTIDRNCTSEKAVSGLPQIQNLENLITLSLIQNIPGRCTPYFNPKNLFVGFRLEPVLLLMESECIVFVIQSQNPLGFRMMCIEQKTAGIKDYNPCFLSTRQITTRKGKR